MKLAREFRRPDWRAMLADMSSSDLEEWHRFYESHYFDDALLDAHFAALNLNILSLVCGENDLNVGHFSLLKPHVVEEQPDPDDEQLMAIAEGLSGGVRYGPASG